LKRFSIRLVIVLAVIIAAVVYCIPTFVPEIWPHKKINLGLDLQGGMHLMLEVNTEKAVEAAVERNFQELRELVKKNQVQGVSVERPGPLKIAVQVQGKENVDKFKLLLDKELRDLRIANRREDPDMFAAVLDLPDKESDHIKKMSVDQALETIRNRVDQFGVSEPDIRRQGDNRILIQLPGIKDTQRAKDERPCWSSSWSTRLTTSTPLFRAVCLREARSFTRSTRTAPPSARAGPRSC
jgi:preprotein translocase subunit SecD